MLAWAVGFAALAAMLFGQSSLLQRMSSLEQLLDEAAEERSSGQARTRADEVVKAPAVTRSEEVPLAASEAPRTGKVPAAARDASDASVLRRLDAGFSALQDEIQRLTNALSTSGAASVPGVVPEYDPTQPPKPGEAGEEKKEHRSYGPEQATGGPNSTGGDDPKTWAPQAADGGQEWLWVGFGLAVEPAQIRIRESYNPGGIFKVTGFHNQEEFVLWEGEAAKASGQRDFVVPVSPGHWLQAVRVYVDTSRVPGWQEIDAVELVGRDGSRQWAVSAAASSWYGESESTRLTR